MYTLIQITLIICGAIVLTILMELANIDTVHRAQQYWRWEDTVSTPTFNETLT